MHPQTLSIALQHKPAAGTQQQPREVAHSVVKLEPKPKFVLHLFSV